MNSSEHSEDCISYNKAEIMNKYFNKNIKEFSKPYFNAVTIKLNTHPSKAHGVVNTDLVFYALHIILESASKNSQVGYVDGYVWELDKHCQLHLHCLLITPWQILRKDAISAAKSKYSGLKNYSIYIQSIMKPEEVIYWQLYMKKQKFDPRDLYYRLTRFYHDPDLQLEDFEDLADHDIEFNKLTGHFEYIDSSKVKCYETKYDKNI